MSRIQRPPNLDVVAIAYDGQCMFELGIATELFGLERPEVGAPWYRLRIVAATPGPVRALGGIAIEASHDLRHIRRAGTIVLPGWRRDITPPTALLAAIRHAHAHGARVMSICSGVFLLAATGLLDGKAATTHWRYTEQLAAEHPAIDVRPNVLFVDNGSTLTSAGSAAGIDLGLHLIRRDHGADIAATVARRLVVAPQRDGGQAQFVDHARLPDAVPVAELGDTLTWMQRHLAEPLSVARMARHAHQSPRTFARRFVAEVGVTPMQWLIRERVRRAQQLLETTDRSIDEVAARVGFGSAETLRHHFRRTVDISPSRYRATFHPTRHA